MNGRPITSCVPLTLRRPLLWAALCSVVLHVPVVFLLSPVAWQHRPALPAESLLVTMMADTGAGAGAEPESEPESEPVLEPVQEQTRTPAPLPEPLPDTLPAPSPALTPQSVAASASQLTTYASVTPPATASDTEAPVMPVVPVVVNAPLDQARPMTTQDAQQINAAIQTLLNTMNESDVPADMLSQLPSAEALGLPAADALAITAVAVNDLNALQKVDVTLRREIDGRLYQMRARLQERALSHYAKFINRWDDDVTLSNDRIDGRFHVNSAVNFESSPQSRPQFNGEVTIASRQAVAWRLRQSTMFAGGLRTGTGRIRLPADTLPAIWADVGAPVLRFDSDTRLEFRGDDGLFWTDLKTDASGTMPITEAGLIVEGLGRARIELEGTVTGKVLVYASRQLLITGDLVYSSNAVDSTDSLAMISEGSIEIAPASVTGAGDLQIHGALYARQRFGVRRFRDSYQGTLYVYGALVAGSVSATEPRFNTHIKHDPRFEHSRPPAFPTTGLFDLMAWDQQWTPVTGSDALLADVPDNVPTVAP